MQEAWVQLGAKGRMRRKMGAGEEMRAVAEAPPPFSRSPQIVSSLFLLGKEVGGKSANPQHAAGCVRVPPAPISLLYLAGIVVLWLCIQFLTYSWLAPSWRLRGRKLYRK